MNKVVKIAMAAALLTIPQVANAAPPDGTYTGPVTVSITGGPTLICNFSFQLSGGGTTLSNVIMSGGGILCSTISFVNQPYSATFSGSGSGIYAVGVINTTIPGCSGIILGTWDLSTGIDIDATLGSCSMVGTVS